MSVKFTSRFDDAVPAVQVGLMNGLTATALVMQRFLRKQLSKRGTGRRYRVSAGRRSGRNLRARGWHMASAPGNPPAADTGRLRNSWAVAPVKTLGASETDVGMASLEKKNRTVFIYRLGSKLVYARALEYGVAARRLAPRPYVRPTLAAISPDVPKIMANQMKRALARIGRQIGGMQ